MHRNCIRNQVSIVGAGNNINIYTPYNYSATNCNNWSVEHFSSIFIISTALLFIFFICITCYCCCCYCHRYNLRMKVTHLSPELDFENC